VRQPHHLGRAGVVDVGDGVVEVARVRLRADHAAVEVDVVVDLRRADGLIGGGRVGLGADIDRHRRRGIGDEQLRLAVHRHDAIDVLAPDLAV
jgi:hypothetical protein